MLIRNYQPTDLPQLVQLFYNTIHQVNSRDYTPEQVAAWAPAVPDETAWQRRYETRIVFVAEDNGQVAGFAELEPIGHIDCFYCHHAYQGQGVGKRLYHRLEQEARSLHLDRLWVEASITAKPFFEHLGFQTLHENQVLRNQVILINYSMEKFLT